MTELERRLSEFVDRTTEMGRFCEMLQSDRKPIMVVWGESGLGKSLLLARMIHECSQRSIPKAEVVWTNTRNHDYLAIMRKLRDDVGVESFKAFTDLVNYFTVPQYELKITVQGSVSVAQGAQIQDSSVGDVAGVILKDNMLVVPRSDISVSEAERMARLTDRFIECLAAALQQQMRVVFFDAVEKMTQDTQKWIGGELLQAVLDGRLLNTRFVLCGQRPPPFEPEMKRFVEEAELRPLSFEHVIEYLAKRGVEEAHRAPLAMALAGGSNVLDIATKVDSYFEFKRKLG